MQGNHIRIFISHCCTGVSEDDAFLDALIHALEGQAEVLVDRRFKEVAESRWRNNIHVWIDDCHLAISLFGKRAGTASSCAPEAPSIYIHEEAALLAARKHKRAEFPWLQVRLDSLELADLQAAAEHRIAGVLEHAFLRQEEALEKAQTLIPTLTPYDCYPVHLKPFAAHLKKALDPEIRPCPERVEEALGLKHHSLFLETLISLAAGTLLRHGIDSLKTALTQTKEMGLRQSVRREILNCVISLWIPQKRIQSFEQLSSACGATTLHSSKPFELATKFTGTWHVARSQNEPEWSSIKLLRLSQETGISSDHFKREVRRVIQDKIQNETNLDDSLEQALRDYVETCGPLWMALPSHVVMELKCLDELKREYPGIRWILIVEGSSNPDILEAFEGAPSPEPTLDFTKEKAVIGQYGNLQNNLQSDRDP